MNEFTRPRHLGLGARGWYVLWLLVAVLVFVADQCSKQLVSELLRYGERVHVLPVFDFTLVHNTGAAFSFLAGAGGWQRWLLAGVAIVFCAWLLHDLRHQPPGAASGLGYAFILGGAAGNLRDRLVDGYVVDFALAHWGSWMFPAFNVADAAVTVGAVLWIFSLLFGSGEHRPGEDAGARA